MGAVTTNVEVTPQLVDSITNFTKTVGFAGTICIVCIIIIGAVLVITVKNISGVPGELKALSGRIDGIGGEVRNAINFMSQVHSDMTDIVKKQIDVFGKTNGKAGNNNGATTQISDPKQPNDTK